MDNGSGIEMAINTLKEQLEPKAIVGTGWKGKRQAVSAPSMAWQYKTCVYIDREIMPYKRGYLHGHQAIYMQFVYPNMCPAGI